MNDAAGRGTDRKGPLHFSLADWRQVLGRTWQEASDDNLSLVSAGVAFYAFLAFVPLLAALTLTYGLFARPAGIARQIQVLTNLMPPDAAHLIGQQLVSMSRTAATAKGFGLLIALLIALYGAMRGATAIMDALNLVFEAKEERSFLRRYLLALAITVAAVIALLAIVVAISAFASIEQLLPGSSPVLHFVLRLVAVVAAAALVSLGLAAAYRYAPNRPNPKWQWLTPGSAGATILWLIATALFSLYVTHFGSYNATYGSLAAVIIFLTWLYFTAYIILMGGELNSETEQQVKAGAAPSAKSRSGRRSVPSSPRNRGPRTGKRRTKRP